MGFELRCVIVPGHDDVLYAALQELPAVVVRKLAAPFEAMIAAQLARDLDELKERNPSLDLDLDEDDDDDQETVAALIAIDGWTELAQRFPDVAFGYVYVDCFGGVCVNTGTVMKNGETVWRGSGQDAHQKVFEQLGLPASGWYFAPFTRGYFGRSYVTAAETEALLAQLVEEIKSLGIDYEIELADFVRRPIRTFR